MYTLGVYMGLIYLLCLHMSNNAFTAATWRMRYIFSSACR